MSHEANVAIIQLDRAEEQGCMARLHRPLVQGALHGRVCVTVLLHVEPLGVCRRVHARQLRSQVLTEPIDNFRIWVNTYYLETIMYV